MGRFPRLTILLPLAFWVLDSPIEATTPAGSLWLAAAPQEVQEPLRQDEPPGGTEMEAPNSCRPCHLLIYSRWSRGMHRYSFEDPIFQLAYSQVYYRSGGEAAGTCLRCHAPAAFAAGDLQVRNPVHRLGVQCDFCHSVDSVNLDGAPASFHLRSGTSKGSPYTTPTTNEDHGVWHQPLLRSSEFCAGCHEYVVEGGMHLVSTYSEWLASPYPAQGKTCQSCHMPTLERVATKDGGVRELNDHDLSGGHSSVQVRKAGEVTVKSVERRGDEIVVVAVVKNVGSGHCLPTGMPSRRLLLEVEVHAGQRLVDSDHRVYRKVVGDADGRELVTDADIKWYGRQTLADNRIRPGESREETFHFRLPDETDYEIKVTLTYAYSPLLMKPEPIRINMGEETKYLSGKR